MHDWVFQLAMVWLAILIGTLVIFSLRTSSIVRRALGLDALALVFVAALGLIAVQREDAGYLDIGLVIAMLGFIQTVATARLVEQRDVRDR